MAGASVTVSSNFVYMVGRELSSIILGMIHHPLIGMVRVM